MYKDKFVFTEINEMLDSYKDFFDVDFSQFPKECCKKVDKTATVEDIDGKSVVTIDVPGYKREEIKVSIDTKTLSISLDGKRGKKTYNFKVTETADISTATSKLEDGVLTIEVGQKPEAKAIDVKIL